MNKDYKIRNHAWVLPRPNKSKYIGSFPLHFEKKLHKVLEISPDEHKILHPFGGKAEFGDRVDINPEVDPDFVGDAHDMHFIKDETYDLVIADPPYSEEYAKGLYGTKKPRWKTWTQECTRVLKENGLFVIYHYLACPSIPKTVLEQRIFLETRVWHKLRCIHIHRKRSDLW